MSFSSFSTPYRWERLAHLKELAAAHADGPIDLSVGSPVDAVPASVQAALAGAATAANACGYPSTEGTAELKGAITRWFARVRGIDLMALGAAAVPSVGSKEAVALMPSLLQLAAGAVVLQPQVSYPTYEIGTQLAACRVVKADVNDPAAWADLAGVGLVWVNSPGNPTGVTLSREQLARIVKTARQIGAVVVSDECYACVNWDGQGRAVPAPSILDPAVCGGSAAGLLCLYSLSKQSNMAGYRAAFIAGDAAVVGRMTSFRKQIGLIVPGPVQAAMVAALDDDQAVSRQVSRYRARLERLVAGLRAAGYSQAKLPDGGLYVWVPARSGDCWQDLEDLARLGLVASPGEFYGDATCLRFSVTASDEQVEAAAQRLSGETVSAA